MSQATLPKPLSAYVGLIVASVEEARSASHSPAGQLVRLPLATMGQVLGIRQHYSDLARQGNDIVGLVVDVVLQRLGGGSQEASEWAGDELSTVRGRTQAAMFTATELAGQVGSAIGGAAGRATSTVGSLRGGAEKAAEAVSNGHVDELTEDVIAEVTERLSAPEPVEVTEPPVEAEQKELTPLQQVEEFEPPAELQAQAGAVVSHADLPLPDFDHMTGPQLRGRLRKLDQVSLVQLLDYERAHGNRLPIVLMLENRISKMVEAGDESGTPQPKAPETPAATPGQGPRRKPGPAQNPPSAGNPTNPAQPR